MVLSGSIYLTIFYRMYTNAYAACILCHLIVKFSRERCKTRTREALWYVNVNVTQKKRTRHMALTHWGRVTYVCVSNLTIIVSDNGLSPGRRQAIIWTNAGILLIGPLGTNFSEILIGIQTFSFKKIHLKMSSAKWRPLWLGLNVLKARGSCYRLHHKILIKHCSNNGLNWRVFYSTSV